MASNYGGCFPAEALVRTQDGGRKRMDELRHGDRVLATDAEGHAHFSDVIMFFHRDVTTLAKLIKLETSGGHMLQLTANHLLFASRDNSSTSDDVISRTFEAIFAKNVRVGDFVQVLDTNASLQSAQVFTLERVERVTSSQSRGLFAPLTHSGTIVVNDYVTSCYAQIESQTIAHAALAPVRLVISLRDVMTSASSYILQHLSFLLASSDVIQEDVISTDSFEEVTSQWTPAGVHWYAHLLHTIAHYVIPPSLMFSYT